MQHAEVTHKFQYTHAYTHCILHGTDSLHLPLQSPPQHCCCLHLIQVHFEHTLHKNMCATLHPLPPLQHTPFAVSPDSMTQSVPSRTALATSEVSARVGRGLLIMLSSIWGEQGEGQEGEGHCEGEVRQQQQTAIPTHTDSH